MRLGAHMRTNQGLVKAVELAKDIGCETIQLFAANPIAWRLSPITAEEAKQFRLLIQQFGLFPVVLHTPYLLNLASPDPQIYDRSVRALIDHMRRANALGAHYVVTHIGSHRGSGAVEGILRVCAAVSKALREEDNVVLLLENSAGTGYSVGSKFEELRDALDAVEKHDRLGFCLDTAHLWAAGYDISSPHAVARTVAEFDALIGIDRLKYLHLNDTHVELGSRVDRHANICTGMIGKSGFAAILNHKPLSALAGVIEVPAKSIETDIRDLGILKSLRNKRT